MVTTAHPILRIRSPVIGRGEQVFELSAGPITIGRADDCDVVLLEQSASRLHARLRPHADGWEIVDESNGGGVWIGGQKVAHCVLGDGAKFRIGETDFQLVLRPAAQPTLIGTTRAPAAEGPPAADRSAFAPTVMQGPGEPEPSSLSVDPITPPPSVAIVPRPSPLASEPVARPPNVAVVPGPPPPRPAAPPPLATPRPAPPISTPSFVDFGPVGRPESPAPSAPSFVDFGPVGRPGGAPGQSASFSGDLSGDPSQIERMERRSGSRVGTWIAVVLLFGLLITTVVALAYDITLEDVMRGVGLG